MFCTCPAVIGSNEGHSTESLESCFARGPINQLHCNRHVLSGKGITCAFPAGVNCLFREMKRTCSELFRSWLLCIALMSYYYSIQFFQLSYYAFFFKLSYTCLIILIYLLYFYWNKWKLFYQINVRNVKHIYTYIWFVKLFSLHSISFIFVTTGENVMSTFPTEASINVTAATDTQLKVNSSDLRSPVALSESVFVSQGCSLPDQRSVER